MPIFDAIQALTQGNSIVSLNKQMPERTDTPDHCTSNQYMLDMTQSPVSLPFWCEYAYVYDMKTNRWTVYNAYGHILQSDD